MTARLPGPLRGLAELPVRRRAGSELRALTPLPPADHRLYVGPWNTAGQGYRWAQAVGQHHPDWSAQSLWAQRGNRPRSFGYPAHHEISSLAQRTDLVRQIHGTRVLDQATAVVFESGRPVLGNFHAGTLLDDLDPLLEAGIHLGSLYHGSDLRDLHQHAADYPHSPFRGPWDDYFTTLQRIVDRNRADLEIYRERTGAPVLVSTPDMLDLVPDASWLPVVIDIDAYRCDRPLLERARPVVLHAPSNRRLKGSAAIEAALADLDRDGLIEYRRIEGVPNAQMPSFIGSADIVIDQIVLGNVGILATEAMAAGRVVISHLLPRVRERFAASDTHQQPIPVVDARPDTLRTVVEGLLADRDAARSAAATGPDWARRNHDGRRSAEILTNLLE